MLTRSLIRSGNIQLRTVPLADFSRGNKLFGTDDVTEFERGVAEVKSEYGTRVGHAKSGAGIGDRAHGPTGAHVARVA